MYSSYCEFSILKMWINCNSLSSLGLPLLLLDRQDLLFHPVSAGSISSLPHLRVTDNHVHHFKNHVKLSLNDYQQFLWSTLFINVLVETQFVITTLQLWLHDSFTSMQCLLDLAECLSGDAEAQSAGAGCWCSAVSHLAQCQHVLN